MATPTSPLILIFIAIDKWRCYDYSLTCANGGLIPSFLSRHSDEKVVMALELILTFKGSLGSNTLEGTTGQPSTRYLQAMIPPPRLKTIGRGLLWISETVQSYPGPRLGPEVSEFGLKAQNGDNVI